MYNVIITSGGTEEKIDEVRKITNNATGKLGSIIAEKLLKKNSIKVIYVCSKTAIKPSQNENLEIIEIEGVLNLKNKIVDLLTNRRIDYFIHTMAVSDYVVEYVSNSEMLSKYILQDENFCETNSIVAQDKTKLEKNVENRILENKNIIDNSKKISSSEENLIIKLKRAPKIISCIKEIDPNIKLVGFKLLNNVSENELLKVSQELLNKNKCELVIGNDSKSFKDGKHEAIFVTSNGIIDRAETKEEIADKIIKLMVL